MSTDLKIYKEVTYIELFDGELIPVAEEYANIVRVYNDNSKAIDLGNELLNKTAIKRIYPQKIDEVDNEILHIADKNLRARVQKQVDTRRAEGKRVNMEVFNNIINRLQNEQ